MDTRAYNNNNNSIKVYNNNNDNINKNIVMNLVN